MDIERAAQGFAAIGSEPRLEVLLALVKAGPDGRTRLDALHQKANAKIRIPKAYGTALEAVLINTAGGLTGGDRLDWSAAAGAGTHLAIATQACLAAENGKEFVARVAAARQGGHLVALRLPRLAPALQRVRVVQAEVLEAGQAQVGVARRRGRDGRDRPVHRLRLRIPRPREPARDRDRPGLGARALHRLFLGPREGCLSPSPTLPEDP